LPERATEILEMGPAAKANEAKSRELRRRREMERGRFIE
jgi:hypothetical protein